MLDTRIAAIAKRTWGRDPFAFPYPKWMPLGFFRNDNNLAGHAFYPGALARAAMSGGFDMVPRIYVPTANPPGNNRTGSLALAAQDSQDVIFTPDTDSSIYLMTASQIYTGEAPVTGATVDIFTGIGPNGQFQHKWNRSALNLENCTGTGQQPFWFKPPLFCRGGEPILVRITNALLVTNTVQICLLGLQRVIR